MESKKYIYGSEEPRGKTEIKTQTWRVDLRTREGGGVGWDEGREWHGHIYTTKCRMDGWWEATAWHTEISLVLHDHLEGWNREGGR